MTNIDAALALLREGPQTTLAVAAALGITPDAARRSAIGGPLYRAGARYRPQTSPRGPGVIALSAQPAPCAPRRSRAHTQARTLEALRKGPLTVAEVAQVAGLSASAAARTLHELQRAGAVSRRGGWYQVWSLPEHAERARARARSLELKRKARARAQIDGQRAPSVTLARCLWPRLLRLLREEAHTAHSAAQSLRADPEEVTVLLRDLERHGCATRVPTPEGVAWGLTV